jgi:pimeloyl-ACP methyl ester carboxylesterase
MTDQGRTRSGTAERGPVARRVQANGIDIAYLEWPGREASTWPPVLLLHGILQTGAGMANLAAHLARHSRVIAPDMRGRGETAAGDNAFDPQTLADDMAALIRTVRLDGAVVIGRMHGGVVAYHLVARYPELVSGLVIGDTPPEIDEAHAEQSLRLVRELPASFSSYEEALSYYQDTLQLSEGRARHDIPLDLVVGENGSLRWRHNLETIERIEAAASPRSDWQLLERITCPTLLIRGQRGAVPADMAERVCRAITRARCRVQTVIGARHDVFLGPGCEQAFGAIDIMLTGLANSRTGNQAQMTAGETSIPVMDGRAIIDRLVRVIHSGDAEAISTVFAPDCRIVQYGEGAKLREGGIDAVKAALAQLLAGGDGADVEVRDLVASDKRLACVFAIHRTDRGHATTHLAPVFFELQDQRVTHVVSYRLNVPTGEL